MVAMMLGTDSHNIKQKVAVQANVPVDAPAIRGMEWLGLFSEEKNEHELKILLRSDCRTYDSKNAAQT
jgi:hypothetical protein